MRVRESAPPMIPLLDTPLCPSSPQQFPEAGSRVRAETTDGGCRPSTSISTTCTCRTCAVSRSSNNSSYSHPTPAYATPTRCVGQSTSAVRRACTSNVYSSLGRVRSGTWSGTAGQNLEPGHGIYSGATTSPRSSDQTQEVQDHALIRGDISWICRQRPQISGSVTLQINLNFARIKRYILVFLYLVLMSICFNAAFQKILATKDPVFFYSSAKMAPPESRFSSVAIKSSSKVSNQKQNSLDKDSPKVYIPQSQEAGPSINDGALRTIATIPNTDSAFGISAGSDSHNRNKVSQARTTFHAKAGGRQPLYVFPTESVAVTTTPSTTKAFFGLIGIIFLTSVVFVKGMQEAHTRLIGVSHQWEQSQQARIAFESSNSAGIV